MVTGEKNREVARVTNAIKPRREYIEKGQKAILRRDLNLRAQIKRDVIDFLRHKYGADANVQWTEAYDKKRVSAWVRTDTHDARLDITHEPGDSRAIINFSHAPVDREDASLKFRIGIVGAHESSPNIRVKRILEVEPIIYPFDKPYALGEVTRIAALVLELKEKLSEPLSKLILGRMQLGIINNAEFREAAVEKAPVWLLEAACRLVSPSVPKNLGSMSAVKLASMLKARAFHTHIKDGLLHLSHSQLRDVSFTYDSSGEGGVCVWTGYDSIYLKKINGQYRLVNAAGREPYDTHLSASTLETVKAALDMFNIHAPQAHKIPSNLLNEFKPGEF